MTHRNSSPPRRTIVDRLQAHHVDVSDHQQAGHPAGAVDLVVKIGQSRRTRARPRQRVGFGDCQLIEQGLAVGLGLLAVTGGPLAIMGALLAVRRGLLAVTGGLLAVCRGLFAICRRSGSTVSCGGTGRRDTPEVLRRAE